MRFMLMAVLAVSTTVLSPTDGLAASDYTFLAINVPGSNQTGSFGINDIGQITGYYYEAATYHGFTNSTGTFATIDVPGATNSTVSFGINNSSQITGYYENAEGYHGFFDNAGTFTTIDVSGANSTSAYGINDAGQVTGFYIDGTGYHGFVDIAGTFTTFNVPGAISTIPFVSVVATPPGL